MLIRDIVRLLNESLSNKEMLKGIINNTTSAANNINNVNTEFLKTAYKASKNFLGYNESDLTAALEKVGLNNKSHKDLYKEISNFILLRIRIK